MTGDEDNDGVIRVRCGDGAVWPAVPPTWVVVPADKETRLGQPALLDCQVEGFPQPSVTWKKAAADDPGQYQDVVGTELPRAVMGLGGAGDVLDALDGGGGGASARGMTILANGSLVLERVRQEDAGRYLCEASNGIGVGLSAVVTLTVHSPVHFSARSRKELARRGQTVTLSCTALGDLPIALTWRRGGAAIETGGRFSIRNSSLGVGGGPGPGLRSELLVQGLQSEDGGLYTCFGRNEYGYDQTQISLLVQDAPGAVGNLRLVEQTSRTASVAWTPPQDGNSIITRYLVRYRLVPGPPGRAPGGDLDSWEEAVTEAVAVAVGGGGAGGAGGAVEVAVEAPLQSAQLSALRPASLYAVTVLAENSLGLGPASKPLALHTDQEAPAAAPTHLAVEASSSTQLTVKWEAPAPESWHGPLLGHYVGYRELGRDPEGKRQYNFTTVPWEGASGAGGSASTVLEGLSKYKQYGVVVQAYNPKGAGPLSTEVVAQTLEDVPEAAPRDVQCAPESPESLRVHWQPPPEALVHGVIQGYRLLYQPVQDQLDVAETQNKMTTELSSTLHGLFKYTNYSVQVLAFTRVGDGNMSAPIFCRTKEDVPGQPAGVKAVLQAPDMALVTWLPPAHPNGQLTKYSVYVRDLEGGRQVDARNNPVPALPVEPAGSGSGSGGGRGRAGGGAPLMFRLPGMRKKHRYEFWVTAHTRVGEGQSSAVVAITPSANVSAAITSFGGVLVVTWKSLVRMACQAVGQPPPAREWLLGDTTLVPAPPRMTLAADTGMLTINSAQRNDLGEYKCVVWNKFGRDHIVYQLIVQGQWRPDPKMKENSQKILLKITKIQRNSQKFKRRVPKFRVVSPWSLSHLNASVLVTPVTCLPAVPPSAPLLLSTGSSQHALQLQWKLGDDGGSPVRGFALHYKAEHGEWEERRVDGAWSTHSLSGLRCGTLYHVYVTAWNRVGSGSASKPLDLRTRGGVPAKPAAAALVRPNATALLLRLDDWPDGGCPLLYFVVECAPSARPDSWTTVSNNIPPGAAFPVSALSPGTEYRLRVTAHNEAGSTQAEYLAATLDAHGGGGGLLRHGQGQGQGPAHVATTTDQRPHPPFHQDVKLVALTGVSVAALLLSFLALLICLRKTRGGGSGTSPVNSALGGVVGGGQTATQDNKHNLARREQFYATTRKLPSPATLECIPGEPTAGTGTGSALGQQSGPCSYPWRSRGSPEYADDIRPYATFHVPGSAESTKLQTFTYRERAGGGGGGGAGGGEAGSSPVRRGSKQSEYCRPTRTSRKGSRSRAAEEYESDGSESDTEPGTSSRTESSNQLDEHAYHFQLHQLHQLQQLQQLQQQQHRQQLKTPPDWSPPGAQHPLRGRPYLPRP
ncbi:Down syndrome cell adhesion molecule-like protein Dscam2 [Frankliniella fusca]|uniref:Down syndrome cell adhesion molecule-like protein Dscam2 n=1 Tax=Frankliniella fusca TaxID=407009 RepID=A0AAE1LK50_9NEOP|nr:Down syndrome cell adhesion molecule-like protein Dscam2 [Frankliniella fusca]